MDFTLNGKPMSLPEEEGESLLALLRDRCGVTSAKDGCAPEGSCGACTVLVDGKAVVSCAQGASRAAGREVTTLEGLSPADRRCGPTVSWPPGRLSAASAPQAWS